MKFENKAGKNSLRLSSTENNINVEISYMNYMREGYFDKPFYVRIEDIKNTKLVSKKQLSLVEVLSQYDLKEFENLLVLFNLKFQLQMQIAGVEEQILKEYKE